MKLQFTTVALLALVLCAQGARPTYRVMMAHTKGFGASLVRVPSMAGCMGSDGAADAPTTTPPMTEEVTIEESSTPSTTMEPTTPPTTTEATRRGGSPSTPTDPSGPPSGRGPCVSCAVDNYRLLNSFRREFGESRVAWNDEMSRLAEQHSKEQYDMSSMHHSTMNYWENVAWGYGYTWDNIAETMFDTWKNSKDGHRENMLNADHQCVGIGIYGDGDRFYATEIFSQDC